MNKKILLAISIVMVFASVVVAFTAKDKNQDRIDDINKYSRDYITNRQTRIEKEKEEKEKLIEKLKGVVCWGGSNTAGEAATSYIDFLYEDLKKIGYDLPVENKGVKDESSIDILGRQGSIPIVVSETVKIEDTNKTLTEVKIKSSLGIATNILCGKKNPGVNPCTIGGVTGTLYGEADAKDPTKTNKFYFQREDNDNNETIQAGTVVQTSGSDSKYKDYINVMWLERKG